MKTAVEHTFTGTTSYTTGTYSSSLTMIGSLIKQFTGPLSTDKYVSVLPPLLSNNVEIASGSYFMPHVYIWSNDIFWIFSVSNATAAATRNISLHEYNKSTHTITWKGFVTLSGTTIAGVKIARGLRAFVYKHNAGTVSTSGLSTTLNGSGTGFVSEGVAAGARIGFGSTDPTQISTWYEISSITDDTTLILNTSVDISSTSYVIEEIRIAVVCTNATLINGGVHLIKGLNYGLFTGGGTTIPEATTIDNIRASYLLKDKNSITCTIPVASPAVVGATAHGYIAGELVTFSTTGTLTGPTVNTTFYVSSTGLGANSFQVSATLGGASVNCTVSSGIHTLHSGAQNIGMGVANDGFVSNTDHSTYILNGDNATTTRIIKFNLRVSLSSITGGISADAYTLKTLGVTTVGTIQQVNNGRVFTINHGAAAGIKSLYFVTSTRVYRSAISDITNNSSSWISDFMLENPPGTITTNLSTSALAQVDYTDSLDRLLIGTSLTGRHGVYSTTYDTSSPPFEKIFGQISNRTKLTTTSANAVDAFFNPSVLTMWTEGGILFAMPSVVTTGLNWLGILYVGADGYYADSTNQYVITPKLSTPNISAFYRVYIQTSNYSGDSSIGYPHESIRLFYRTQGIDDNSGYWTESISGDLTGVAPDTAIQFKIYFDIMSGLCVPRKVYSIACTYEDGGSDSQDSHYLSSADFSDKNTKTFAWKHSVAFGYDVPTLRIRLYNAITDGILDDDDSVTQSGTWQRSIDGGSNWATYSTDDKSNNTTFIRFTPASIPDNVQVKALLTLN